MERMVEPERRVMTYLDFDDVPDESDWPKHKAWMIRWLEEKEPNEKQNWFFVKQTWLNRYKMWLNSDGQEAEPGPIETETTRPDFLNERLLQDDTPVHSSVWNHLKKRFTLTPGDQIINRRSIFKYPKYVVERNLYYIYIAQHSAPDKWVEQGISRLDREKQIRELMREWYNITLDDHRHIRISMLWNREEDVWEVLEDSTESVQDIFGPTDPAPMAFVMDTMEEGGGWSRTLRVKDDQGQLKLPYQHLAKDHFLSGSNSAQKKVEGGFVTPNMYPGLCGLESPDCADYMVTVNQVLAAIPSIRDYFLTDTHLAELNPDNPLAREGSFATTFGHLVKLMWSGRFCTVKPMHLKNTIGRFNEDYDKSDSRDVHEFLIFFLDGLHEDCNRILSKPYVTPSEVPGRPVSELAEEAWTMFKKRNDSVIVDLFYGLTKTSSTCRECSTSIHTFEPTPCLSLFIPTHIFFVRVCFRPCDLTQPFLMLKVALNHEGSTYFDLRTRIAKQVGIAVARVHFAFHHEDSKKVGDRHYEEDYHIPRKRPCKLYEAFEVPENEMETDEVPLVVQMNKLSVEKSWARHGWQWDDATLYDLPFSITVPNNSSYDQVYEVVYESLVTAGLTKPEEDKSSQWWTAKDATQVITKLREKYGEQEDRDTERKLCEVQDAGLVPEKWVMEEGKRYIFALVMFRDLYGRTVLIVEFHPDYVTQYLKDVITGKPNVKILGSWSMQSERRAIVELTDCLNIFHLSDDRNFREHWYCSKCKCQTSGRRTTGYWTLPHYLAIHLQRFQYCETGQNKEVKVDSFVRYPEYGLDLEPYVTNPDHEKGSACYDLMAVINQEGLMSPLCTYNSFVRHPGDNCWYHYDKYSYTSKAFPEEIVCRSGYLLFYKRRDVPDLQFTPPPGGATEPERADPPTPPERRRFRHPFPGMSHPMPQDLLEEEEAPYFTLDMDMPTRVRPNFKRVAKAKKDKKWSWRF